MPSLQLLSHSFNTQSSGLDFKADVSAAEEKGGTSKALGYCVSPNATRETCEDYFSGSLGQGKDARCQLQGGT